MSYPDLISTLGGTPLVELARLAKNLPGRIFAKLEMRNPCGSVKDRVGAALIQDAEARGVLKPGMTIVEATGGNTGVGLAFVAAIRGYDIILTMPDTMSVERVALLRQLGAKVVLTPGILMNHAVARAEQIAKELPGAIILDQFKNPANPEIHRRTTAIEIWEDTQGAVDSFVSAVGTGGTITGVGEVLKARKPGVRVIAVEPANSAILSGGPAGNHQIPGIGIGFVPDVLNRSILDEVIPVTDADAFACAKRLAREEAIIAGVSSGAAVYAALAIASRKESAGKTIVVILADTGERYITTNLFSPEKTSFDRQPLLKGRLLELRPLRPGDYQQLYAVASDPLIWEQHPANDRYKEDVFRAFFGEALESGGALIAIDSKDGRVIGSSRFHGYDEHRSEIEIGWTFLARSHWGGSYNGEMKQLMLRHAFQFVTNVIFVIGPQNFRSQKAVEKIGGIRAGSRPDGNVVYRVKQG